MSREVLARLEVGDRGPEVGKVVQGRVWCAQVSDLRASLSSIML